MLRTSSRNMAATDANIGAAARALWLHHQYQTLVPHHASSRPLPYSHPLHQAGISSRNTSLHDSMHSLAVHARPAYHQLMSPLGNRPAACVAQASPHTVPGLGTTRSNTPRGLCEPHSFMDATDTAASPAQAAQAADKIRRPNSNSMHTPVQSTTNVLKYTTISH